MKINSSLHGVVCKDDLKLANVSLEVAAQNIGIQADTSLRLYASSANVSAGHDAIQLSDSDNDSFLYSENSDIAIQSGYDGISVKAEDDSSAFSGYVYLKGGSVNMITSAELSLQPKDLSRRDLPPRKKQESLPRRRQTLLPRSLRKENASKRRRLLRKSGRKLVQSGCVRKERSIAAEISAQFTWSIPEVLGA